LNQKTIRRRVEAVGIGLHKGNPINLVLEPLSEDSGIVFYRSDMGVSIPLGIDAVVNTKMATVIGVNNSVISTIEHLLSAIYAYGIDNIRISVDSDEIPVMDGSAISFCMLLDEAGIEIQNAPKRVVKIKKSIEVKEGEKFVRLEPDSKSSFNFVIEFAHPTIKRQTHEYVFNKNSFLEEIARARTFGFAKDIQFLQSRRLALGASLKNAIGLDERRVLNTEGLRFDNEFVRHKILDAMGDMMVVGHNIIGKYTSFAGSHDLNHKLTKELFSNESNYEIVEMGEVYKSSAEVEIVQV